MPRDGSGVASKPAGTTAATNTTIESAKFNSVIDDIYALLNAALPITAGGTAATSAAAARSALGIADQAWELIETKTASASASLSWTGLSAYRVLRMTGTIRPATDAAAAYARVSTDNGATYVSTSTYNYQIGRIAGATNAPIGGTTTGVLVGGTTSIGNAANELTSFEITFEQFNKNTYMMFHGTAIATTELGTLVSAIIGGSWGSSTPRDAIQIIMDSGNITDGYVTLEGIRG